MAAAFLALLLTTAASTPTAVAAVAAVAATAPVAIVASLLSAAAFVAGVLLLFGALAVTRTAAFRRRRAFVKGRGRRFERRLPLDGVPFANGIFGVLLIFAWLKRTARGPIAAMMRPIRTSIQGMPSKLWVTLRELNP